MTEAPRRRSGARSFGLAVVLLVVALAAGAAAGIAIHASAHAAMREAAVEVRRALWRPLAETAAAAGGGARRAGQLERVLEAYDRLAVEAAEDTLVYERALLGSALAEVLEAGERLEAAQVRRRAAMADLLGVVRARPRHGEARLALAQNRARHAELAALVGNRGRAERAARSAAEALRALLDLPDERRRGQAAAALARLHAAAAERALLDGDVERASARVEEGRALLAGTGAPTPGAPTPGAPTPGAPTPGASAVRLAALAAGCGLPPSPGLPADFAGQRLLMRDWSSRRTLAVATLARGPAASDPAALRQALELEADLPEAVRLGAEWRARGWLQLGLQERAAGADPAPAFARALAEAPATAHALRGDIASARARHAAAGGEAEPRAVAAAFSRAAGEYRTAARVAPATPARDALFALLLDLAAWRVGRGDESAAARAIDEAETLLAAAEIGGTERDARDRRLLEALEELGDGPRLAVAAAAYAGRRPTEPAVVRRAAAAIAAALRHGGPAIGDGGRQPPDEAVRAAAVAVGRLILALPVEVRQSLLDDPALAPLWEHPESRPWSAATGADRR